MPSSPRVAYDDFSTPQQMHADCEAVGRRLPRLERAARAAVRDQAPSLEYADYPREVRKRDIEVSEAAARLAAALYQD